MARSLRPSSIWRSGSSTSYPPRRLRGPPPATVGGYGQGGVRRVARRLGVHGMNFPFPPSFSYLFHLKTHTHALSLSLLDITLSQFLGHNISHGSSPLLFPLLLHTFLGPSCATFFYIHFQFLSSVARNLFPSPALLKSNQYTHR